MARIKNNKSQIATVIVFIIAVIFLFALVSVNLSRIAQKKTIIDNVADGVGLQLASQLGSMANAIKHELEIWGDKACDWNWQLTIFAPILVIVTVVLIALTIWGAGVPGGLAGAALWGVFIGSGVATVGGAYTAYVATSSQAAEQMKIKFANMSAYQQIVEMPMQAVILSLGDDPTWVEDTTDMDRNPKTTRIPRLFKWYNLRLNTVPRAGLIVQKFYKDGFNGAGAFFVDNNGQQRFYIDADEDWKIKPGKDSVRWWIDFDSDAGGQRELKMAPWIKDELIPMLKELRTYGYGINVTRDLNIDDNGSIAYELMLGNWIYEIETFENEVVRSFYNMDFDSAVQGLNTWVKMLKKNDNVYNDPIDWFGRLRYLKMRVDAFKNKLIERRDQIHACVVNCKSRQGPDCFSENCENGPACASECTGWDPCPTPDEPDKMCCSGTRDTKWTGCCGEWKSCGELCYTQCEPDRNKDENKCVAPLTGQKKWCCELTVLDPYKNPRGCRDNATIIEDYPNPITGVRHNAIWVLQKFVNDLQNLSDIIGQAYEQEKDIKNRTYDQMHEAFYVWQDKVAGTTSNPELVGHILYVRTDGFNPRPKSEGGDGFDLPKPTQSSEWRFGGDGVGNYICRSVENASGEFALTVARYDEAVAKDQNRGIGRFWKFIFGKKGISPGDEDFVRNEAIIYNDYINRNLYFQPSQTARLKDILKSYGIVTKVKVKYGPGVTRKDQKSVSAPDKNKDIYISETSSSLD